MKWKKLGKIFDPLEHKLYEDYIGYAQSPQVLVFEDFVRIYFSIRKESENKKFVSHIQFIDMDKQFKKIINKSQHEVIATGALGCFDEHGIFPINVLRHNDKIYAYTSGWSRRVSVSVETSIGLAISRDNGSTFERVGSGPVLTASLNEPYLVVDGFVKVFDDLFHMWYIYGTDWVKVNESAEAERTYKIGHAVSKDGIFWEKEGRQIIQDKIDNECQALPTVIKIEERFYMFFAYRSTFDFRNNSNNAYRIGYAYSDDLVNWIRDDENVGIDVSSEGWDAEMISYPHVFECDKEIYMLYNGNHFGKNGFGIAKLENL
ncbi:hypothetical protein [Sulfuricurvum sp.]|uniref:hypothetical protein n=1 Tax=Sulfuricurvum sp. TaxID=2025608 RepID=UPI002E37595B|nr:hypothetical protein [Sulfuricurvum sp.]HEX5329502.1 hypothetical protein [Sulfuricurvum sp.]